ncbi:TIR domain-containing protein [candidate division KSB1 bacterium]|nr:TIR domain-containing protein [candidate division KSB1 bacterium]
MMQNKPRVFISHAWEDKPLVLEIEQKLETAGVEVWVDHSKLRGGQNLPMRISEALDWCNTLLLVWSGSAAQSHWVNLEWTNAVSLQKLIIPCMKEKVKLPAILTNTLFVDFTDSNKGIADLLNALQVASTQKVTSGRVFSDSIVQAIHGQLARETTIPKMKPPQFEPEIVLRSIAESKLNAAEVKSMLKKHDFYCKTHDWTKEWSNPGGKGIKHNYEKQYDGEVVFDRTTGLYWQQSGAIDYIPYKKAEDYIAKLNRDKFAGYSDWRLPTLEEAMSLMEPTQKNGDLYIDSVFDKTQRWIWTVDKESASRPWFVGFLFGDCGGGSLDDSTYVRAVR